MVISISRLTKLGRVELVVTTNNIAHSLLSDNPDMIQEITDNMQSLIVKYIEEKKK
jgi:hypothetical protein